MYKNIKSSPIMKKKIFLDDLTVFILSIDSAQLDYALEGLEQQNCEFKIDIIKNISPMSKAHNQMIDRCQTKYFIQVDEYMIVYPDTIKYMYECMKKSLNEDPQTAMMAFRLLDKELGSILGIKIYHYSILKYYRWDDIPIFDRILNEQLKNDGYTIISSSDKKHNVGTHALYRNNFELFLKSVVVGSRIEDLSSTKTGDLRHFFSLYENALNDNNSDKTLFRLAGLFYGLFSKFQPDFTKYPHSQFKDLELLLNVSHEKELGKIINNANQQLTNLIQHSQENLFNLSDRIYSVWKEKKKFYTHFDKNVLKYLFTEQTKHVYVLNDLGTKMTLVLQLLNQDVSICIIDVKYIKMYQKMCTYCLGNHNSLLLINNVSKKDCLQTLIVDKHSIKSFQENIKIIEKTFDEIIIDTDNYSSLNLVNFKYESLPILPSFGRWVKC